MPKPAKTHPKQKIKPKLKHKAEPETPSITTKKSYWIFLVALLVVVSAVFGVTSGLGLLQTAFLVVTVAVAVGFIGFVRVNPSTLSASKRATFIFAGASVIGFSIWAAIAFTLREQILALGDFVIITSLIVCLVAGAFVGELLGRYRKVQERLFPQKL